ncbi:hypothetical protein PGTUg99_005145 [Puccinia graminis f. sp. tritici]|uniref:Uncharacterized protein n=1 Tax=Puccinia graminis f. sp. tritici TaxID=56615 RepID=A0A5B0R7U4_PUCGR|nr:hypothetical protein PGTUg99_005145 [Puccinia graminis f. sp. tritici]
MQNATSDFGYLSEGDAVPQKLPTPLDLSPVTRAILLLNLTKSAGCNFKRIWEVIVNTDDQHDSIDGTKSRTVRRRCSEDKRLDFDNNVAYIIGHDLIDTPQEKRKFSLYHIVLQDHHSSRP